jgi:ribosomal protein uS3
MQGTQKVKKINTKKKFVADGVFRAELNEFLQATLGEEGYAGIEVRATSMSTEIRVRAASCKDMLAKPNRKIKEIKSLIQKRYNFNEVDNKLDLSIKPLPYERALSAAANCENLKFKLLAGTPVRNAANNILGTVMRQGKAIGCEVRIAGKIRGQRAAAQKYTMGYQVSTGQPKHDFIDKAIRHVELRQGMLGLKVMIMGAVEVGTGPNRIVMPDVIKIMEPKDEDLKVVTPQVISNQQGEDNQGEAL